MQGKTSKESFYSAYRCSEPYGDHFLEKNKLMHMKNLKKKQTEMKIEITEMQELFYLNKYGSKNNFGIFARQVSKHLQFRCHANLNCPWGTLCTRWNQFLKARYILNDKLLDTSPAL
jgi:hypothetical protein